MAAPTAAASAATGKNAWEPATPSPQDTYIEIEKAAKKRGFVMGAKNEGSKAESEEEPVGQSGLDEIPTSAMLDLLPLTYVHHYFLHILTTQFGIVKRLSIVSESAEAEKLAKTMMHILSVYGADEPLDAPAGSPWNATSFRLLQFLIDDEFQSKAASDPSAILRANNLTSRLMLLLSKDFVTEYISNAVGPVVKEILDNNVVLEIDPSKIKAENPEAKANDNVVSLATYCEKILSNLSRPRNLETVHRAVRAIAGYTGDMAQKYTPTKVNTLIGGFVMLRLVNPAIITPSTFGFDDKKVSGSVFRTLTLITKVMQNLANGVQFGIKEPYMVPLNVFLDAKRDAMINYLNTFASDPNQKEGKVPWEDYKQKVKQHKKVVAPESVSRVKVPDLVFLQYQLTAQKDKIYPHLGPEVPSKELFFWILDEMGAPLDPNLKTVTIEDLEKQRTVRKFMISLEKFTHENLVNQEILREDGAKEESMVGKILRREDDKQKELKKMIKDHQFTTLAELIEKLSHPLLGVSLSKDKTFVAVEMVDWLYSNLSLKSRSQSVELANQLSSNQLILPVSSAKRFKDDNSQWKFRNAEEIAQIAAKIKQEAKAKPAGKLSDKYTVQPLQRQGSGILITHKQDQTELTDRDWQLLLIGANMSTFKSGDVIVKEGELNRRLYRIKSGSAVVTKQRASGADKRIGVVGPGAMLCEMSVIDKDGLTSATVVASSGSVDVCVIDVSFIHSLFGVEPDLSKRFFKHMAITIAKRMNKSKNEEINEGNRRQYLAGSIKETALLKEFLCTVKKHFLSESITLSMSRVMIQLQLKKKLVRVPWTEVTSLEITNKEKLEILLQTNRKKHYTIAFRSGHEFEEANLVATKLWTSATKSKQETQLRKAQLISASGSRLHKHAEGAGASETLYQSEVLNSADWNRILCGARTVTFKPDRPIIRQGQPQPSIYVLTKGRCRVELQREEELDTSTGLTISGGVHELGHSGQTGISSSIVTRSTSSIVAYLEKGQMFGELSFLLGGKSTASVFAHETEVEVQIIEDAYLNILFVRQPALAGRFYHHLASVLANRVKENEKRTISQEEGASR